MVGRALMDKLQSEGYYNLLVPSVRFDLRNQQAVNDWYEAVKPEYVFHCAAMVGGIKANNQYRADFIYDNLMMEANVIHGAYSYGVTKLLFLGSSCIYPRSCPQPIREEYLLGGYLEQTNEPYAVAKIAGIKMVESYRRQYGCDFISAMPCNLYGPNDNFNIETGHVIPSLMRKAQTMEHIDVWGSGKARREFMHVDDLAEAMHFLMCNYSDDLHINVGTGRDMTIEELLDAICEVSGFKGSISFDRSMSEGVLHKLLDVRRINQLGWVSKINIYEGLEQTWKWLNLSHDNGKIRV
jgi:GDP-L-fucose synthase